MLCQRTKERKFFKGKFDPNMKPLSPDFIVNNTQVRILSSLGCQVV